MIIYKLFDLICFSLIRGTYKKEPCAVKLIFTTDLTEEVISRVIAEATLLSAVQVYFNCFNKK